MSKYEFKGTRGEWHLSKVDKSIGDAGGIAIDCIDPKDGQTFEVCEVWGVDSKSEHNEESRANAQAISEVPKLIEALRPFAEFIDAFDAKPLSGMSDKFYTIHAGTEHEATISRKDMRDARSALAQATSERTGGE